MTTVPDQHTLLLLDAPTLLAHAYRSTPPDTARALDGQPTNAVAGFLTLLLDAVTKHRPTHLAAAFDGPGENQRAHTVPGYRPAAAAAYVRQQQPLLHTLLRALTIPTIEAAPGLEAADLIASLAATTNQPTVILSSDDRLLTCLTDTVTMLRPAPGRPPEHLRPGDITTRYGVPISALIDYLALRGDRPRGLTPIPGVGDKTARTWLTNAGALDELLLTHDRVRAHADRLTKHRRALTLTTNHPTPDPATLTRPDQVDPTTIDQALTALGLPTARAAAVFGAAPDTASPPQHLGPGQLLHWLADHANGTGTHALALTTDAVAITAPDRATAHLELRTATGKDREVLGEWLARPDLAKAVHDAKTTRKILRQHGWKLQNCRLDLLVAGYLLAPGEHDYSLTALTARHLNEPTTRPAADEGTLFDAEGEPAVVLDALSIAALAPILTAELSAAGMVELYDRIEHPLTTVLADLEDRGVAVDVAHLRSLREEYTAAAAAATAAAAQIVGHPVTLGSTKQLQRVLFTELALPPTRRIKSGYSTAADELARLHARTGHPFLTELLSYRAAIKLAQMIDGLLKHLTDDNRIHTTLLQTKTETGRLASEAPNLQNIPIRTRNGLRIREGFVPGTGFDLLLSADYSQIEMRIMAHASGDRALLAAFDSGEDMHRSVAALAFGVPLHEVTAEQRRRAKAISYGLAYGQTVHGLANDLGIPLAEARDHYTTYFDRFGAVRDYLDGLVDRARRTGYTETLFGRRRYLPNLASANPRLVEAAERAALNAPIQGTAADIIKLAMIAVDEQIRKQGLRARMLLQIHDELLFELPTDELGPLTAIVEQVMPTVAELSIPLAVSVGAGRTWAEAHT
ncbi:DNA polymerase I [Nocardia farcinica]|uniref:DNA polymerase I n=1 Tax=Nocardia farcinica TaxID=37329 RepID=UPI0018952F7F|nr:DNA polymerase I [Nocardia farcinica]MBF6422580.1 DNA polymerase I [Nocardia farcinica]MBF6434264.1 DNA polymerase I [Nocardia farcinica]MBF6505348.1 DNA polymerase I [Nocardia farcinica]